MSLMVRDVLDLKSLKEFRLVAGEGGLNRSVQRSSILDYEYDDAVQGLDEGPFSKHNFIVSSLLFAKNDESKILKAVQGIYSDGVSALAVKTVLFKKLPDEVIQFADEKSFPIFLFDTSFFEDIIEDLNTAIRSNYVVEYDNTMLYRLIREKMTPEEVRQISKELHPTLKRWIQVYYCTTSTHYENQKIQQVFNNFVCHPHRGKDTAIFYFHNGFLFFISNEGREEKKEYTLKFSRAIEYAGLTESEITVGSSRLHGESALNQGILEAMYAWEGAKLTGESAMHFEKLGSLRLLLSGEISYSMHSFSEDYLRPLRKENEGRLELMKTAISYVKAGGNIQEAAKELYVHENTVRYRIGRIKDIIGESAGEYIFFQNLAIAVWIYLIEEERRQTASVGFKSSVL